MVYSGVEMKLSEYLDETERYIERFFGNNIADYDLKNGFMRVNVANRNNKTNRYRTIEDTYQPRRYKIPEDSRMTTHDVAMLGYLAMGIPDIARPQSEWHPDEPASDVEKQIEFVYNAGNQITRRGMCIDSFFTLEPRYITGEYGKEMTQAFNYTKDAIENNDIDAIAKICKDGLKQLRRNVDTRMSTKALNYYADCYVCEEILTMLEKNPDIKEKAQISPEEMAYYNGLCKYKNIIENGEKAKERLESGAEIPEQEKVQLEEYVHKYTNLQLFMRLRIENEMEKPEVGEISNQLIVLSMNHEFEKKYPKRGAEILPTALSGAGYAVVSPNDYFTKLGETKNPESFLNEISEKMDEWIKTKSFPEFKNIQKADTLIDTLKSAFKKDPVYEELMDDRQMKEFMNDRPEEDVENKPENEQEIEPENKPENEQEIEPENKPENEQKIEPENKPENEQEIKPENKPENEQKIEQENYIREDAQPAQQKSKFDILQRSRAMIEKSIDDKWQMVNKWSMDNFLRGSSDQFKDMKNSIKQIRRYMKGNLTQESFDSNQLKDMLDDLAKKANAYLDVKDAKRPEATRTKRNKDSYANRRYNFAIDVAGMANQCLKEMNNDEIEYIKDCFTKEVADNLLKRSEFSEYKQRDSKVIEKAVEFTLQKKGELEKAVKKSQENGVDVKKMADVLQPDVKKIIQFIDVKLKKSQAENSVEDTDKRMVEFLNDAINNLKNGYEQKQEKGNIEKKNENVSQKSMEM